ncbi:hypothetical protein V6Z92_008670 [Aspergillus fumigatus]
MVPWFDYLKAEGYGLSRQLGQGGQSFGQCHTYRNGDRGTLVQIVVLRQDPVRYILEMFWGTHLMNFATWEGVYCLFPETTLKHKMVVLHSREEAELSAYDKYCQRGFLRVRRKEVEDIGEFRGERDVYDHLTCRVGFYFGLDADPVGGAVGVGRFTVGEGGIRFKRKWVVDDSYDESADDCE